MHGFKAEGTACAFLQPAKCMQGGKGHVYVCWSFAREKPTHAGEKASRLGMHGDRASEAGLALGLVLGVGPV